MPHTKTTLALTLATLAALSAVAEEPETPLELFHAVPPARRKAFSSNRPSQGDTPYTVDSGVVQFETGALAYMSDRRTPDGSHASSFTLAQTNVRLGVTAAFELQTIVTPYVWARRTDAAGVVTKDSGLGDTTLRGLYSLSGADGKGLGVSLLPFVKLPSNQSDAGLFGNRHLEGGVELPLAYALDDKTSVGATPGVSFEWNGDGRDANPFCAVGISRAITGSLSAFAEVYGKKLTGQGSDAFIAQIDLGAVYQLTANCDVDFAAYHGLTKAAPDWMLQTGFTVRF